jgi:D-psicose/D-tagatose/L-ribulose 3-epimerase
MKLSVSNIAWDIQNQPEIFELLQANNVSGVEIAPTKFWPAWQNSSPEQAALIRQEYSQKGFEIPALQAILFDKPALKVFGDKQTQSELLSHIDKVAALAKAFGAKVLVFGSPKNRDPGTLSNEQATSHAVEFFHRAGEICMGYQVQLCLEPNPGVYQCNFMTHWQEILEMVERVSHPGIGVHLDTACISLEGDDVVEAIHKCAGKICHFHVTEANLGDFSDPQLNHEIFGQALKETGYDGWLSIEMRQSDNPEKSIQEAVQYVLDCYR